MALVRINSRRGEHASEEFQLAVECCRGAFAGGDTSAVRRLAATVDWKLFIRTVRYHRVQGLVWKCLSSVRDVLPRAVSSELSADALAIAASNLRIAAEMRGLRSDFEGAGVALLFVKGLTLGSLAYPDPLLKMGWDIDLLIDPTQLETAAGLLCDRGYRPILPTAPVSLQSWHRRHKESIWKRDSIHVELHTRLTENPRLIPQIDVNSPRRQVEVASGITLPTLAQNELFAYLCVHGASSLWFRLKWITDLAAMLSRVTPAEIEQLYARSQDLGAGRASSYALLLADRFFETLEGSALRAELARDWGNRWLLKAAVRQLTSRREPREPTSVIGGTAAIHFSQLLLLAGARFKLSELLRQARSAFA